MVGQRPRAGAANYSRLFGRYRLAVLPPGPPFFLPFILEIRPLELDVRLDVTSGSRTSQMEHALCRYKNFWMKPIITLR